MRDVSTKSASLRSARASATLNVATATIAAIRSGEVPKADPLGVARVAGIQAAKNTSLLIPYCHQIPLDHVAVDIVVERDRLVVTSEVKAIWKTGVEMEALMAASVAALTLYDMLKPLDDSMVLNAVTLLEKKGGKSGHGESGAGIRAAVLVVSDSVSGGTRTDQSGAALERGLKRHDILIVESHAVPDDRVALEKELRRLTDEVKVDLIVTTGGTGVGPRDITPETTAAIIDRRLEGVEETLRRFGQVRIPTAMLSRAIAGLRGSTLILNFPGSPRGVEDGLNALFPAILHTFRMLKGEGH